MSQSPPPPPFSMPSSPDWMQRNWKWFIPLSGFFILLCCATLIITLAGLLYTGMKSSGPYAGALARAQASPAVIAALGSPVKDGLLFTGNISENNSSGSASLVIPIHGPKGKADLYVSATRSAGQWHFDSLIVQIAATDERLDITDTNQTPAATTAPGGSSTVKH